MLSFKCVFEVWSSIRSSVSMVHTSYLPGLHPLVDADDQTSRNWCSPSTYPAKPCNNVHFFISSHVKSKTLVKLYTSWWLNQPISKINLPQIGSFPEASGWKFKKPLKQTPRNHACLKWWFTSWWCCFVDGRRKLSTNPKDISKDNLPTPTHPSNRWIHFLSN